MALSLEQNGAVDAVDPREIDDHECPLLLLALQNGAAVSERWERGWKKELLADCCEVPMYCHRSRKQATSVIGVK
jgi:hypothetical protein